MKFKQKDLYIKTIFKEYQKANIKTKALTSQLQMIVNEQSDEYFITKEKQAQQLVMVAYINDILNILDEETRFFIENEYLVNKEKTWWTNYYSRSTYYRIKNRVLTELLFYLKEDQMFQFK